MNDIESRVTELLKAGVGDPPQRVTVQAVRRQKTRRQVIASLGAATASVAVAIACVAAVAYWAPRASREQPGSGLLIAGQLQGVAVLSARDAWAVGYAELPPSKNAPLIVHWNGNGWRRVKAPAVPGGAELQSVAGTSPDDVWAVGYTWGRESLVPVIVHWNGQKWQLMHLAATRPPGGRVRGVAASSASDAWAVGYLAAGHGALIMHWNGSTWTQAPTPGLSRESYLLGVAALSARDAWAVGDVNNKSDLILHWNGTKWMIVRDRRYIDLVGVATASAHSVWAVGQGWVPHAGAGAGVRMTQWNGTAWQAAPGLNLARGVSLNAVAASSASNVWAVGSPGTKTGGAPVLHWNGRYWSQRTIPELPWSSSLNGLSVISADDVWAVGYLGNGAATTPEILHWNGTSWERAWGSATTGGLQTGSCGPFQACSGGRTPAATPGVTRAS